MTTIQNAPFTKRSHTIATLASRGTDVLLFTGLVWGMAGVCAWVLRGAVDFAALERAPAWAWGVLTLIGWLPASAALMTQRIRTGRARGFASGWQRPELRYMLIGCAVPTAYATAIAALTWLTGAGTFDAQPFTREATGTLGNWANPSVVALCYGLLTLLGGTLFMSVFALGEELGWSGFVVPRLLPTLGVTRTALVTAVIWTLYHLPLILFAKNYTQGTPLWFTLLGFASAVVSLSFVAVWLRARSGSIWPVVLLHASHNVWMFNVYEPLTRAEPTTPYVGGEHGFGMMLVAVTVLIIFGVARVHIGSLKTRW